MSARNLACLHRAAIPQPTLTRPELPVLQRLQWKNGRLYNADPDCRHYVVGLWSGVKCVRCNGWYCA